MIIRDNFNSISKEWITSNFFISEKFIQCFITNNKSLRHLFIKQNNNLIYSQFFNINLEKSSNYLNNNIIVVIMEPSIKNNKALKVLFKIYFKTIVTNIGYLFSKNFSAYNYLSESVKEFADSKTFLKILSDNNFIKCVHKTYSLGVIDLYFAKK